MSDIFRTKPKVARVQPECSKLQYGGRRRCGGFSRRNNRRQKRRHGRSIEYYRKYTHFDLQPNISISSTLLVNTWDSSSSVIWQVIIISAHYIESVFLCYFTAWSLTFYDCESGQSLRSGKHSFSTPTRMDLWYLRNLCRRIYQS